MSGHHMTSPYGASSSLRTPSRSPTTSRSPNRERPPSASHFTDERRRGISADADRRAADTLDGSFGRDRAPYDRLYDHLERPAAAYDGPHSVSPVPMAAEATAAPVGTSASAGGTTVDAAALNAEADQVLAELASACARAKAFHRKLAGMDETILREMIALDSQAPTPARKAAVVAAQANVRALYDVRAHAATAMRQEAQRAADTFVDPAPFQ